MRDVAALAGVGLKTVSRVVNEEPGVSAELSRRVHDAIRLLGYRHNLTASSLRRGDQKTATIGLILEDVANPFSSAIHRAIEDVARQQHTLVLAASNDGDIGRERAILHTLISRRVDGFIIVPIAEDYSGMLPQQRPKRPVIFVDRRAVHASADILTVDNRGGIQAAVAHLAAYGHRRIGFLGDRCTIWTARERHLGYIEGLAMQGIRLDPRFAHMDVAGSRIADEVTSSMLAMEEPPTAFVTGQNLITVGAICALQRLGLQHRVALIGFDDVMLADLLDPAVSVVAQDPSALGSGAAELLFARLNGDHRPAQHHVLPTRLIPRGSGEILPRA